MNNFKSVTFIGGPHDGTTHEVDIDFPVWHIPDLVPIQEIVNGLEVHESSTISYSTYTRKILRVDGYDIVYYIFHTMSPHIVWTEILTHYGRKNSHAE